MAYSGGKLGLMLARRILRREDGLQHQSGSAFVFDAETLAMDAKLGQTSAIPSVVCCTWRAMARFLALTLEKIIRAA